MEKTEEGYIADKYFSEYTQCKKYDSQHVLIQADEFEKALAEKASEY